MANMLACATQHAIGWFWKQRQDRPHSMSLSSPHTQALCLIFYPSPLAVGGGGGHKNGEWRRETEIVAGEWESERQTHRGPWRLPITLPRAAERERQRDPVPRRPSYTMRLQRHFYIMCLMERSGLVYANLCSHGSSTITATLTVCVCDVCVQYVNWWTWLYTRTIFVMIILLFLPHPLTPPPPSSKAKLLTKTRKLTEFDLLCLFALQAVLSVLNVRWCPVTPRRLANGFHKLFFNSLYRFSSLQAQWFVYVPPGLTFKNSTVCPHSVFMYLVWLS